MDYLNGSKDLEQVQGGGIFLRVDQTGLQQTALQHSEPAFSDWMSVS